MNKITDLFYYIFCCYKGNKNMNFESKNYTQIYNKKNNDKLIMDSMCEDKKYWKCTMGNKHLKSQVFCHCLFNDLNKYSRNN